MLIVMDAITSINPKKDSSLAMMWAAQKLGFSIDYCVPTDLFLSNGLAFGQVAQLTIADEKTVTEDYQAFHQSGYQVAEKTEKPLSEFDVILMRKDPPFDMRFYYMLQILAQAERDGAWVVNNPQSLIECNEKLFATQFPELMTPTLVSSSKSKIKSFVATHQDVIVKPLDGMGGSGIFRLQANSPNIGSTIEMLTELETLPIMAQRYIPEIKEGDKRILIIHGKPADYCLARIPADGETRGNLAAGGSGVAMPLSDKERAIAEKVAPVLLEKGLHFVGLDVIGDYITEINVTSPTCIREIDAQFGTRIAEDFIGFIKSELDKQQ